MTELRNDCERRSSSSARLRLVMSQEMPNVPMIFPSLSRAASWSWSPGHEAVGQVSFSTLRQSARRLHDPFSSS